MGEVAGGPSTTISESWELAGGSIMSELCVPVKVVMHCQGMF